MKVCENCGVDIDGHKDGDNLCQYCENVGDLARSTIRGKRRRGDGLNRRTRDALMRSLGLVKVRGALGGTYWE